jgi:hypothetical protein
LNVFRANPWIERFYVGGLDILVANHCEIKDLATKSGEKFDPDSKGSDRGALSQKTFASAPHGWQRVAERLTNGSTDVEERRFSAA